MKAKLTEKQARRIARKAYRKVLMSQCDIDNALDNLAVSLKLSRKQAKQAKQESGQGLIEFALGLLVVCIIFVLVNQFLLIPLAHVDAVAVIMGTIK